VGRVIIGDDVEIGANTCVDRGTLGDTRIDRGAKVDNLVQVGHNAHLAEGAVICGKVGLAGSASVGRFAYVGGLAGISNQVHVGDGAKVGALSLITKDVPPGESAAGNPQREGREFFKIQALLSKLLRERQRKGEG
jgi:UDP-3-O-[3-hydroxymyristoyl] glucosamine N-acyltransferase